MATTVDPEQKLGALVAERPALAATLERLRLDYCCGGGLTLAEACRRRGLDPDTVATVLAELEPTDAGHGAVPHDLRGATLTELCDHIIDDHHARLRQEVPRIAELLDTVVRVHGGAHLELHDLQRLFVSLAGELLDHLESEEARLFPAVRTLERQGTPDRSLAALVEEHAAEHEWAGDALAALRELTDGYRREDAFCRTHRHLLEALEAFELDLHQHVHEENNLLFPRLLAAAAS